MIEKKILESKKQELEIKEFIKKFIGKGKVSEVRIDRTPVGEKIVITTSRPGLVIGHRGEIIQKLGEKLKKLHKLENPQIEVSELTEPIFDARTVADQIALSLERFGHLRFKLIAYRKLEQILKAGALGAELRLSGKLPSDRSKSWRFAFGYLKKTGGSKSIVNKALALAFTKPGVIGVKVSIVPKNTKNPDKIGINKKAIEAELKQKIELEGEKLEKKIKKEKIIEKDENTGKGKKIKENKKSEKKSKEKSEKEIKK